MAAGPAGSRNAIDDTPTPDGVFSQPGYPEAEGSVLPGESDTNPTGRGLLVWDGRGPWGGNVKALVPDPMDGARVLCAAGLSAAREAGGVWLSTDSGRNWADTGLHGMPAYALAPSLSEPGVFYAGYYDGLYRSTDSGPQWTRIAFTGQIIGVGVKADDGNILIAGLSSNQGIRRSTDRGQSWLAVGMASGFMKGLGVSPANPARMYLAMSGAAASCFRSDDGGQSWVPSGPATDGWGLWVDPMDAERAILSSSNGIYVTVNGGGLWTLKLSGTCYANVSVRDGVLYAPLVSSPVAGAGVYESTDFGQTWTNYSSGIVASFFYASGAAAGGVLAGHYGGIYRSEAPASPWVVSQTGLNNAFVRTLAYYADRHELWAGTDQSGLWRSTDDGLTWELKTAGLTQWSQYRLSPKDHEHGQGDRMFLTTSTGVFRSADHGESWELIGFNGEFMRGILVHPGHPDRVWTGGAINQQIWRSENGGDTWQQVGQGIVGGFYPDLTMGRNPSGGDRLFVNYEQLTNRIYYSDDLGATFVAATGLESTTYQPALTVRDAEPQFVFCGTDVGVYRSTDHGATWQSSGLTGLVWSLLGTRTSEVYAGRNRLGVFVSPDNGGTWQATNTGIENQVVWDICYGSVTTDLFCSPRGRGIKMYSLEVSGAPEPAAARVAARIAPNPFAGDSEIRLERPASGDLEIRILDAGGRIVRTDRMNAGAIAWSWNGRDSAGRSLANGTYFYELFDGEQRSTGSWVIVR